MELLLKMAFESCFRKWREGKIVECFLYTRSFAESFLSLYNISFLKIALIYKKLNWVLPSLNWTLAMNKYGTI